MNVLILGRCVCEVLVPGYRKWLVACKESEGFYEKHNITNIRFQKTYSQNITATQIKLINIKQNRIRQYFA